MKPSFQVSRVTLTENCVRLELPNVYEALKLARERSADDMDAWWEVIPTSGPRWECDDPIVYMHGMNMGSRGVCARIQYEVARETRVS